MIIDWKDNGPNIVPIVQTDAKGVGRQVGQYVLLPGLNDVPFKTWEKIKALLKSSPHWAKIKVVSTMKTIEETEEIETMTKDKNGKDVIKKNIKTVKKQVEIPFAALDDDKCLELIGECYNLESLKTWKKLDDRKLIKNTIDEKIEDINSGKDKKKKRA